MFWIARGPDTAEGEHLFEKREEPRHIDFWVRRWRVRTDQGAECCISVRCIEHLCVFLEFECNAMEMLQWFFGLGLFLCLLLQFCHSCPHGCYCYRTHVRCMFLNLDTIPNVPTDTTVLDLRFNKLKRIPRGSFPNLPNLNTLLLNNNELETLEEGSFNGLPQLRYLYLYKNRIQSIGPNTFKSVPHLEQLFLHSNGLSRFPQGIFANNHNLRRLRLDSNALVCDCNLMWLADMLKEKHGYTQAAATCQYPRNLQGRSLMSIPKDDFHCEKPRITMEPRGIDIRFGNTAYFTCRAEGNPDPEIKWLHNDNEIDTDIHDRYHILDDGTLMIENAQDEDSGVYECIAQNAAGSVKTDKVELRYVGDNVAPSFIETPVDLTSVEGHDIVLVCSARGNPEPQISWTHNTDSINSNIRSRQLTNGSLYITNIRVSDAGTYECSASNSVQTVSSSAQLRVLVRPVIVRSPVDVSVAQGQTVNFTCEARGDSQPVLTWNKDGHPLRNNGRYEILRSGEVLRIRNVIIADQGIFTCKAENAAGETTSNARLRIIESQIPTFGQQSDLVTGVAGADLTLRCVAEGRPTPFYDWLREGRILQNRNRILIQAGELTIRNVQFQDAGRYDCVAENVAGSARKSIFLQIHGHSRARPGDRFVSNAIPRARQQINFAVNETRSQLFDKSRSHTVQDILTAFRYPAPEALDLARAEEIFEQTLEIIHQHVNEGHSYDLDGHNTSYEELVSPSHLLLIANMSGCLRRTHNIDCSNNCFDRRYRTMDGTCNNLQNPTWGASNTAFNRLLPPIYENGFNAPVGWSNHKLYRGTHLPSARLVSSLLLSTNEITNDDQFTHMLMQWGQFVDHDMDLAPQAISYARFSDGRRCNDTCDKQTPCFPIPVPASDPRISGRPCLGFTRTSATCNTGSTSLFFNTLAPRQQLNALTSFIDASNVYGNTERMANSIRNLASNRGLLQEGPSSVTSKRLLPFDDDTLEHIDCQIEPSKQHVPCFRAGDPRANEQLALTAMHTLWMRQHNHIATVLNRINPHWDGNKIYHESRKIIGALMQHITYKFWLPKILGPKGMAMMGPYQGYQPDVNPSIVNEFAVAALRFGHTLVQPVIFRLNETFQEIREGHLPLHKAFFAPYRLLEEGGIDPLLRGMFGRAAKKRMPGEFFNSELTEKLFELANALGQDLASLNIQRGRDHGIQFYNDYREHCGLTRATTFEDLRQDIQYRPTRDKLQALYNHPDNIDLFIGGLSETPVEGSKVGPTFLCILTDQFKRTRDGDRFWYERDGVFSSEQLVTIKQSSLSTVLCQSSDSISRVQKDVFLRVEDDDDYLPCDQTPQLDLRQWTDCCEDCRTRATLTAFTARHHLSRGRRSVDHSHQEDRYSDHDDVSDEQFEDDSDTPEEMESKNDETLDSIQENSQCSNEDMELMETRIEGVEEIMMEMSHIIDDLKRKVRRLTRTVTKSKSCKDSNNKYRRDGQQWQLDSCSTCICKNGQVECSSKNCEVFPPKS